MFFFIMVKFIIIRGTVSGSLNDLSWVLAQKCFLGLLCHGDLERDWSDCSTSTSEETCVNRIQTLERASRKITIRYLKDVQILFG